MMKPTYKVLWFTTILWIVCSSLANAQSLSGEVILSKMYEVLNNMSSLHYTITSIDTTLSGDVRQQSGEAMLSRNHSNQQLPFKLYGKDDQKNEFIFDGRHAVNIYHNRKEFEFWPYDLAYRSFIGLQGGQMLIKELLFPESPFNPETSFGYSKTSVKEFPDSYVITLTYPDNLMFGMLNRLKILTIDKKTSMPLSVHFRFDTIDGEKQVNIRSVDNIRINDESIVFPVIDLPSLTYYRQTEFREKKEAINSNYEDLLNSSFIDMQLKNIQGSVSRLSDKGNKVVLLAFWETWCSPCIESIPKINQFVSNYSPDAFEVWSIASDERTFDKLPSVVKRTGINYPVYYGTEQIKKDYYVNSFPRYIIIDQSGKIAFIAEGFTEDIEKKLNTLLK